MDHALVLTKKYNFEKGMLYLYGKLKLYAAQCRHAVQLPDMSFVCTQVSRDLATSHGARPAQEDSPSLQEAWVRGASATLSRCRRVVRPGLIDWFRSDEDSNLWVQALSYFASKPEPFEEEIVQILECKLRSLSLSLVGTARG